MKEQISSQDWTLLSSYLDGELNPREKTRVEALMENRPEIREAYQSLERTKNVLKHAPRRRVPRNFTLSSEYARQPRGAFRLIPALRLSSAVAALMSVFLVVAQLLPAFSPAMTRSASPEAALTQQEDGMLLEMAPAAGEAADNLEPPIIYWGGPPLPQAEGMGGAGFAPDCPDGRCGGAPDYAYGMGGGGGIDSQPPVILQPQSEKAVESPQEMPELSIASEEAEPLTGSGPILGVREPHEQGMVLQDTNSTHAFSADAPEGITEQTEGSNFLGLPLAFVGAIVLFALAVIFLVTALILNKVSRS